MKTRNRKKRTPIPGLAEHIAVFTNKRETKAELAAIRAAFADKVYALSRPARAARLGDSWQNDPYNYAI